MARHLFRLLAFYWAAALLLGFAHCSPSNNNTTLPLLQSRSLANGVPLRILAIGDSTTDGHGSSDRNSYRATLRTLLTNGGNPVTYVGTQASGSMANGNHEGYSGAVISTIADRSVPAAARFRPNVILLMAGTNDMNNPTDPSTAPSRLASLVDRLAGACPDAVVVVAKLVPNTEPSKLVRVQTFNAAVPGLVSARQDAGKKVIMADMFSAVAFDQMPDKLHPNDAGYAAMASEWYRVIAAAASRGWIQRPVDNGEGGGGGGGGGAACVGDLFWYRQGVVAGGVGSGDPTSFPQGKWINAGLVFEGHKIATGKWITHLADLDGDGRDDVIYVNEANGAANVWLNTANGGQTNWVGVGQVASGPGTGGSNVGRGVRFVDINGDGKADYLTVAENGDVGLFINGGRSGSGNWIWKPKGVVFNAKVRREDVRLGNIDGDGRADIAVVGTGGSLTGHLNVGGGDTPRFRAMGLIHVGDLGAGLTKAGVVLRDLNGDGRADYLHLGPGGQVTAHINNMGNAVGAAPGWLIAGEIASGGLAKKGQNVTFGDLNGDGKVDYVVADQTTGALYLWQNAGSGGTWRAGENIFLADMTGDGKKDYLIVSPGGAIELYTNGGPCTGCENGWMWTPVGKIAGGVTQRANIRFADLDGDGRDDYLVVNPATSAVTFWRNGGRCSSCENGWLWINMGQVAGGAGRSPGKGVRFADLNGDGRADWIHLDSGGAGIAYINGGACPSCPGGWAWTLASSSPLADGVGARLDDIIFADIDGDGRADYLVVDPLNGAVTMYRNGGPGDGTKWIWYPTAKPIATGVGYNGRAVRFADLNGDGRAEYIGLSMNGGRLESWNNGCTDEQQPGPNPDTFCSGVDNEGRPTVTRERWNALDLDGQVASITSQVTRWNSSVQDMLKSRYTEAIRRDISGLPCKGTEQCTFGRTANVCMADPKLTWILTATTNFNNFMFNMGRAILNVHGLVEDRTAKIVDDFYPLASGQKDISAELGILNGILTMIGAVNPIAAGAAGFVGFFSSVLAITKTSAESLTFSTFANLANDLANSVEGINRALENYVLQIIVNTPQKTGQAYVGDDLGIPKILSGGAFAESVGVPTLPEALFGAFISPAIDYMWNLQQVVLVKVDAASLGSDPCSKISAIDKNAIWCDPAGVAHVLMAWPKQSYVGVKLSRTAGSLRVHGLDKLKDYDLTIENIRASADRSLAARGFLPNTKDVDFTMGQLLRGDLDLRDPKSLLTFTTPVCDIRNINRLFDWNDAGVKSCNVLTENRDVCRLQMMVFQQCTKLDGWPYTEPDECATDCNPEVLAECDSFICAPRKT